MSNNAERAALLDLRNFLLELMAGKGRKDMEQAAAEGNAIVAGGVAAEQLGQGVAAPLADVAAAGQLAPGTSADLMQQVEDEDELKKRR